MDKTEQDHLIYNLTGELKRVETREVVLKMTGNFYRADVDFGRRLADSLSVATDEVKKLISNE